MNTSDTEDRPARAAGLLRGALAGTIATGPMTAAMLLLRCLLPPMERYPLPPKQIAVRLLEDKGPIHNLAEPWRTGVTLVLHFGYGAFAGALYTPLARRVPLPAALRGMGFGLGIWAASYLGWLPALGILAPATDHPTGRNILMITAHLIWGAGTGLLVATGQPPPTSAPHALPPRTWVLTPGPAHVESPAVAPALSRPADGVSPSAIVDPRLPFAAGPEVPPF